MKRASMRLVSLVVFLMVSLGAQAQEFQISDIRVEGLQRVSAGSVFSALPVRVGDTLRGDDIQRAARALFRAGHFEQGPRSALSLVPTKGVPTAAPAQS